MAVAVFDTNILIDFLKGYQPAIDEFSYWDEAIISAITWMEVMAGTKDDDRADIVDFLASFTVVQTDPMTMRLASDLRRTSIEMGKKMPLPDAVIMATGLIYGDMTVTRNKKDFQLANQWAPGHVRIPYELTGTTPVSCSSSDLI
jgi:predicted nucleic acid-binding protein